jgi:hypothetical protein
MYFIINICVIYADILMSKVGIDYSQLFVNYRFKVF